ncbi:serine hydrolase [bacterium]|nr:serine hydrolase [bacterium]
MKTTYAIAAAVLVVMLHSCRSSGEACSSDSSLSGRDITGCWRGGRIDFLPGRYEEARLITRKPDGSLAQTFIMELDPGCRVWDYDIPVTGTSSGFSWLAHTATLNTAGDTLTAVKEWKGERSLWRFVRDNSLDSLVCALRADTGASYTYTMPRYLHDGWPCAEPEDEGFDREKLVHWMESIAAGKHGDIHSVLIARNGRLILEEYFSTSGKRFGECHKEYFRAKPHRLASVTKGILSLVTGIAVDQGKIPDTNERIWPYLKEYAACMTPEKKDITIDNLLTMTAGLDWNQTRYSFWDPRNHAGQMFSSDDVPRHILSLPLTGEPGKTYCYSNGVPVVLAALIEQAVGMETDTFTEAVLFHPLGIMEYQWTRYPDGSLEADGGLALRSRDLAKIGQLLLQKGEWDGKRVISGAWLEQAMRRRIGLRKTLLPWTYGYYWMQTDIPMGDRSVPAWFVPGSGGQMLAVFPEYEMVVVFTAANEQWETKNACFSMIHRYVLPALSEE